MRNTKKSSAAVFVMTGLLSGFSFQPAAAAIVQYSESSNFAVLGTVEGADHLYLQPASYSTIGRIQQFDPSLGTLVGIKVYASLVGSYQITSHCDALACNFTTNAYFSDNFYSGPPGTSDLFSGNGYNMHARLTQAGGCDWTFTVCSNTRSGSANYSKQVEIQPDYFDDYTGNGSLVFQKSGYARPDAFVYHETPFPFSSLFLEACIDDCGDGLGLLSLVAYIANRNHVAFYNDTHFKYSGYRYFQVDYTYEPALSPVPLPASLPLFVAGLAGLGFIGRCKRKPAV